MWNSQGQLNNYFSCACTVRHMIKYMPFRPELSSTMRCAHNARQSWRRDVMARLDDGRMRRQHILTLPCPALLSKCGQVWEGQSFKTAIRHEYCAFSTETIVFGNEPSDGESAGSLEFMFREQMKRPPQWTAIREGLMRTWRRCFIRIGLLTTDSGILMRGY